LVVLGISGDGRPQAWDVEVGQAQAAEPGDENLAGQQLLLVGPLARA